MAVVNRDRRYVAVNKALLDFYHYTPEEVIGARAGRTVVSPDRAADEAEWQDLLATNELYGERVVEIEPGNLLRVSFAAHGRCLDGRWLALIVTLSAQFEPNGDELIGSVDIHTGRLRSTLSPRELEVARLLTTGATTEEIANQLYLSPATVRTHVRNAMFKTRARTRAQLVAIVLGEGILGRRSR
jgi:DNA-binding CsgD family transcriptional regulator